MGVEIRREWTILSGCPADWNTLGVSAAEYAANGIIQSSVTARKMFAQVTAKMSVVQCLIVV